METNICSLLVKVKNPQVICQKKCTKCGICLDVCPDKFSAVKEGIGTYQQIPVA